ncbi:MAG TPA: DUF3553 domain-containing protein [Kofleriaceae bacterium]|nr:DUF3553 domain-containing protein [Kofleriaceae bacterium]
MTCDHAIGKGAVRVAEQFDDLRLGRIIHRFHHLECAVLAIPSIVSEALDASGEADLPVDRAALRRQLDAKLEAARRARRERYVAQLVAVEDAAPLDAADENLDETARDLLAQLADDEDNTGVLAVLADTLLAHGEPRGELIAVQLALRGAKPAEAEKLIRRRDELIVELSPPLEIGERCAWGIGFVRRAELIVKMSARLLDMIALWRHPSMRIVREVELELTAYDELALTAALAPLRTSLRRLVLSAHPRLGALSELVATLPALRQLGVGDGADFERLAHPRLTRLIVTARGATPLHDVVGQLSLAALPQLRELGLRSTADDTDATCEALAHAGWLGRLTQLDLVHGTLGSRGLDALAAGLAGRKLARLDVTGNPMPLTWRDRLAALCEELVFPDQVEPRGPVFVEHRNKPEWGRGRLVRRYDGKLEVEFPHVGTKVFKADASFLRLL